MARGEEIVNWMGRVSDLARKDGGGVEGGRGYTVEFTAAVVDGHVSAFSGV